MMRHMSLAARGARLAGRAAVYTLVALAVSLGVAWLLERWPALGGVVSVLAVGAWALVLWRIVHADDRLRAAVAVAATFVVSAVVVVALDALLATDPDGSRGASLAAETPGVTAPGPTGSTTTASTPTVSTPTASTPTATPTAGVPEPAPTPSAGTGEAEPPPGPALAVDDAPDDCGCGDGELTGLGLELAGGALTIRVDGRPGPRVWVWDASAPGAPLRVDVDAGADGSAGLVRVADAGPGPWAVVSAGGDRVPDLGYLDASGAVVTVADRGPVAARLQEAVAEIQAALPGLDEDPAALVVSLLARRHLDGTTVLSRTLEAAPDRAVEVVEAVAWPAYGQRVRVDGTLTGAAHQGVDLELVCAAVTGAAPGELGCEATRVRTSLDSALAIVRSPAALVLDSLPDREVGGTTARCVRVVASPDGGPSIGDTCWRDDGVLVWLERPGLDRIELVSHVTDPDPGVLAPPEVPS